MSAGPALVRKRIHSGKDKKSMNNGNQMEESTFGIERLAYITYHHLGDT